MMVALLYTLIVLLPVAGGAVVLTRSEVNVFGAGEPNAPPAFRGNWSVLYWPGAVIDCS